MKKTAKKVTKKSSVKIDFIPQVSGFLGVEEKYQNRHKMLKL